MEPSSSSSFPASGGAAADSNNNDWFLTSLQCLHYPNPNELLPVLDASNDGDDNNNEPLLARLVLWLEDRVIRMWTLDQRDQLQEQFMTTIADYLNELSCPSCYLTKDWHKDSARRVRVIFWLLSVATAEAYGDAFVASSIDGKQSSSAPAQDTPIPENYKRKAREPDLSALKNISQSDLASLQNYDFALGFSTGDPQVDGMLTLLRMTLLLDLEQEQQYVNQRIAQLQTVTVPSAKSLKKYKPRRREK